VVRKRIFIDETVLLLNCELSTNTKNNLRLKGHPLPENDIWIAAIALQYNLILVTRDAHFLEIENLQTVVW
jgi:tRNA(fMet)-specific endonuclease VapC